MNKMITKGKVLRSFDECFHLVNFFKEMHGDRSS